MKDMEEFRSDLRLQINHALRENFNEAHQMELYAVKVYIKKAKEILDSLDNLDLTAQDEDGNFVNRGQMITLMMIFKEQQGMVGKLAQTDAAREYALHVRKMKIKRDDAVAGGIIEEAEVTFMDEDTVFFEDKTKRIP